jgi:hypothetical protein
MPLSDAPRTAAGSMGTTYDALALDLFENVPELTFPLSLATYSKMRNDPQISTVLKAYTYPLRSATYAINPKGCRDEVVELCADAWGLPIAGDNDGPGPARRRGVQWDDHLRIALLMLPFGFSPFAQRYEIGGDPARARLAELSERLPQTITDIETNDDGSLKGIKQNGQKELIPANHLLWYVHEREGAAWQGRPMIRESYGPWLLKNEMLRVLGQSNRRFGMGVPEVQAPPGAPPADVTQAAQIAAGFRAGDQAGIGMPSGFSFNLKGMTGSAPDTLGFIRYLDSAIAASVLANVLSLPDAATGNRALGDTIIGLLQMSWKTTAREITGPATQLNVQMVDYNFGEDEPVPAVLCTDINRPEVTSEAISSLVTCGALTPELGLENDLRIRYSLPVIQEEERQAALPAPAPEPGRTNEPAPEQVPA